MSWWRRRVWLARDRRTRPALLELLDAASAQVETVGDRVRTGRDDGQAQPDWVDLLERVEHANASLRTVIECLGYEPAGAPCGSVETRPMAEAAAPGSTRVGSSLCF
jgi:hypothetical protein